MFKLQKLHPGDTPEHSGTWISSDWSDGMAWGRVESFVHSEQVLSLLSSLLSHTKWKCQQWRRATCFFRSFQRQCPLSLSLNPLPCWLFQFFTRSGHCCREQLHSANTNTFSCPNPQNKDLFSSTPCSTNYFTRLQLWKYTDAYEPRRAAVPHSHKVTFSKTHKLQVLAISNGSSIKIKHVIMTTNYYNTIRVCMQQTTFN